MHQATIIQKGNNAPIFFTCHTVDCSWRSCPQQQGAFCGGCVSYEDPPRPRDHIRKVTSLTGDGTYAGTVHEECRRTGEETTAESRCFG